MPHPLLRWITTESLTLGTLLERLDAKAALDEGRVFVGGQRAQALECALAQGELVEIYRAREASANVRVLAIEDELIFAYKPAGIPTEPDPRGASGCLLSELGLLIEDKTLHLHALSRLDTGVSGVVLVSTSNAAAKRVNDLRAAGRLRRRYVAIAAASANPRSGVWKESIGRGSRVQGRKLGGHDAETAETRYTSLATVSPRVNESFSLLALEPVTGRTHQLRVHAAGHGLPLLGDRRYAGPSRWVSSDGAVFAFGRIALHAAWVEVPTRNGMFKVTAEPARELVDWWRAFGGSEVAFEDALADAPATSGE